MSLIEQVFLRIFLVLMIAGAIIVFRIILMLIQNGWNALVNRGKPKNKPQVQAKQPAKPPVTPVRQPPQPPVLPNQTAKPPVVPEPATIPEPAAVVTPRKPQEYKGTIPLDPDNTGIGGSWQGGAPAQYQAPIVKYTLRCLSGPYAGREMVLQPNTEIIMGRNPGCTIQFPPQTPGVSGIHCKLSVHQMDMPGKSVATAYLTDNNSTYGTFLGNGQRLVPGTPQAVADGTTFFLGSSTGPGFRVIRTEQ